MSVSTNAGILEDSVGVFDSVDAMDPGRGAILCADPMGILDLHSTLQVGAYWRANAAQENTVPTRLDSSSDCGCVQIRHTSRMKWVSGRFDCEAWLVYRVKQSLGLAPRIW